MPRNAHEINVSLRKEEQNGKQWNVSFNDLPSHSFAPEEIAAIEELCHSQHWQYSPEHAVTLGTHLFDLLNGSGGTLARSISQCHSDGKDARINLNIHPVLDPLPFEMIYNNQFLGLHPNIFINRIVDAEKKRIQNITPQAKELHILFMACDPVDLPDKNKLQFETEEDTIIAQTEKFPARIGFEDTGTLEGLEERLREGQYWDDATRTMVGYDIVHITGHGDIDNELGPVLLMEDEYGKGKKVTPGQLWEAMEGHPPQILFLSCGKTGQYAAKLHQKSFAERMVEKGIPFVLAWNIAESDRGATIAAGHIYEELAKSQSMEKAVQTAKKKMEAHLTIWPILRLYKDGTPFTPLILPGQKPAAHRARKNTYKYFENSKVRTLETGFIGRRRQLQIGTALLNGKETDKYGVLITGTAGVGKSTFAGKLLIRAGGRNLVIFYGEVTCAKVLLELEKLFRKNNIESALEILHEDLDYRTKIKKLFAEILISFPVLFYFDGFEQNLVRLTDEKWSSNPDFLEAIIPFVADIPICEQSCYTIITSRHPFILEDLGEDKVDANFITIPLMSFRRADMQKLEQSKENILKSYNKDLYLTLAGGNGRLLDWLDEIAAHEETYDLSTITEELRKIEKRETKDSAISYLADIISKTKGEAFLRFLQQISVYRIPLPATAFFSFGDEALLRTGVAATLLEEETVLTGEPVYWVSPAIKKDQFEKCNEREQTDSHEKAFAWYNDYLKKEENPDTSFFKEAVFHGLACGKVREVCGHAVDLGQYYDRMVLYREKLSVLQKVASRITDDIIAEAVEDNDENPAGVFNGLGRVYDTLGDYQKAIEYSTKALEILKEMYDEIHPQVAVGYNNLGETWRALGDPQKAIEYFTKALEINTTTYGVNHPNVAIEYNNLGMAWNDLGEPQKAIEYYTQALEIDKKTYAEMHPSVAIRYNNLGGAWRALGEPKKAIEYYTKALNIDIKTYGANHPVVARDYNNIGIVYDNLGEPKEAIKYLNDALEIDLRTYGEVHPDIAICYNNLGVAWNNLGNTEKAIEYHNKALEIDLATYGENHPVVAKDLNNLGAVWNDCGEQKKAIEYATKALDIDLKTYGENHPDVADCYYNIGNVWKSLGEPEKAIEFFTKAIAIIISIYNENHPTVAIGYNNLGEVWRDLEEPEKAIEFFTKAIAIDKAIYGEIHPNVAVGYNNLGEAWRDLRNSDKAIYYYNKALDIDLATYGENHPKVALRYNNLGSAWRDLKNPEKAIKYYNKALDIDLEIYGENHPNTATSYNNLGLVLRDSGKINKAIDYYTKALDIDLETYGKEHPNIAVSYNKIGELWGAFGNYDKEIEFYNKALKIDGEIYGDNDPKIALGYTNIGMAYKKINNKEKAVYYFNKALKIYSTALGPDHPNTRNIQSNISQLNVTKELSVKIVGSSGVLTGEKCKLILSVTNNSNEIVNAIDFELDSSSEYHIINQNKNKYSLTITRFKPQEIKEIEINLEASESGTIPLNIKLNNNYYKPTIRIYAYDNCPYTYGPPIKNPNCFFGRKNEIEEIKNELCSETGPHRLVIGEQRSGKTSLLFQIERLLPEYLIPLHISFEKVPRSLDKDGAKQAFEYILDEILYELNKLEYINDVKKYSTQLKYPAHFERQLGNILNDIKNKNNQFKLVFLWDEGNDIVKINEEFQLVLRSTLNNLTKDVRLVLTCSNEFREYTQKSKTSPLKNIFRYTLLEPFKDKEITEIITKPAGQFDYKFESEVIERIKELSGGHPYYLQVLCAECFKTARRNKVKTINKDILSFSENKTISSPEVKDKFVFGYWAFIKDSKDEYKCVKDISEKKSLVDTPKDTIQKLLNRHLIVKEEKHHYRFTSELFRIWIVELLQ